MSLRHIVQNLMPETYHAAAPLLSTKTKSTTYIEDNEFGSIMCRRHRAAKYVRLRLSAGGELVITMPPRAPIQAAERLLNDSRQQIRHLIEENSFKQKIIDDGVRVGHSHTVHIIDDNVSEPRAKLVGLEIELTKPVTTSVNDTSVQAALQVVVQKALQKEARAYLPRRLRYLAEAYGYDYKKVRFGTQRGRWGSCSSNGTISLNVGLMNLPVELIDYVLIHELCHTKQMNHSKQFWALVENCLPDYRSRRKQIKSETPTH